jgi:HK97 family phage major capsid protein
MKTPQQLKEARAERVDALDSMMKAAEAEGRDNTTEETQRADDLVKEIEDLDQQIERAEKIQETLKRNAIPVTHGASTSEARELTRAAKDYSLTKAINETANNRLRGLEREMQEEAIREFREAGISPSGTLQIPIALMEARAISTTISGSTNVTGEVTQPVMQGLVPDSILERAGANRITGVAGDVLLPSLPSNATGIANETSALADSDAMAGVKISPVKMASRIDISQQALAMSAGSFDAVVAQQFRRHSGALIDQQFVENVIADEAITYMERKETAAAAIGDITFQNVNGLVAKVGDANGISADSVFLGSFASMASARVTEAVTNSGAGILQGDQMMGYGAFASSVINKDRLTAADYNTYGEVYAGTAASTAITNSGAAEPFLFANMADTYVCYWGGADLIVDQFTSAHLGVTRLIMNVYANAKTGHAASAAYFVNVPV